MNTPKSKQWIALCLCVCLCACMLAPIAGAYANDANPQGVAPDIQTFLTQLLAGDQLDALYAHFSPAMKKALSRADFAALPSQLAAYGTFVSFSGEPAYTTENGLDVYIQRLVFEKGELNLTYALGGEGEIAGIFIQPAPPRLPEGVQAEDCVVGAGRFALPGTLTLPLDLSGPVPAVVLVHGSGPNDRDESIGATKLFADIAHFLAKNGVAALRYDKRTYAHGSAMTSEEIAALTVWEETEEDAILAGKLLQGDPRIDAGHIYLLGHSMGAMLAPEILSLSGDVFAGAALLNGAPRTLLDVVIAQNKAAIAQMPLLQRGMNTVWLNNEIAKAEGLYGMDAAQLREKSAFSQPLTYWASFPEDTAGLMLTLDKPFLIMNGGSDFQIADDIGHNAWKAALEWAERENITILHFPHLNHLLMRFTGDEALRGTVQEYNTPATLDDEAAQALLSWLTDKTKEGE